MNSRNSRSRRKNYGQNFLVDDAIIADFIDRCARTRGPILEIGPGAGALTEKLAQLDRPITAVEIDPRLAARLKKRLPAVDTINADFLRYEIPETTGAVVGNVAFNISTAVLRKLFQSPNWEDAVLILQWDVARRRSGVHGTTLLSAQVSPWFTFRLGPRIPAQAFHPRPAVDAGVLEIRRRPNPRIPLSQAENFQAMIERIYTGRGNGIAEILARQRLVKDAKGWCRRQAINPKTLPPQVPVDAWIDLFETTGASPPKRR